MYRKTLWAFVLLTLILTVSAIVPAGHADPLRPTSGPRAEVPIPFDLSALSPEQALLATGALEAHRARIEALRERGTLTPRKLEEAATELFRQLDHLLQKGRPGIGSRSDCRTACSQAMVARDEICEAAELATDALAACPASSYAVDAAYYASTECTAAEFTVEFTCDGPTHRDQALAALASSRARSQQAWSAAWYSYWADDCTDNYDTAVRASNAYIYFNNAAYYMASCR
jgi:hypothetical protein